MIKNIGNCSSIINWDEVIKDCENTNPAYIGPSHGLEDNLPGLDEILDIWRTANYKTIDKGGTVGWDMFLPGKQFDYKVVEEFNKFFNIECTSLWISRIWPGRFAPIHWDVSDNEDRLPGLKRYHCHIGKPKWGHIFIAGDQSFYNQPQGETYEWLDRKIWHAGTNCGVEPKYILNAW